MKFILVIALVFLVDAHSLDHSLHLEGRQLVKKARQVFQRQPTLYRFPGFEEEQKFPLWAQSLPKRSRILYQVLSNPKMISSHHFVDEYMKLYQSVDKIVALLPEHLFLHMNYNPTEERETWVGKVNATVVAISNREVNAFVGNDCDYVAQPLNYLWFGLEALKLMDKMGQNHYGEAVWSEKVQEQRELLGYDALGSLTLTP